MVFFLFYWFVGFSMLTSLMLRWCRWKHLARWSERRKSSLYWSRWGFAWQRRTSFELRSSARRL